MNLTAHAALRMTQRAFPAQVVETILAYGRSDFVRGAESVTFDKRSLSLVAEANKRLAIDLERYVGSYVVVGDEGQIVTIARRQRRLRHS